MINCLIVDDEEHAIKNLLHCIEKTPFLNLVASTTNPLEGLHIVNTQNVDLIFLDIQMPEISGLDFIKAINHKSKVILTTAYSEFALKGYELDVIDYLLKPITLPRFLQAVQKATNIIDSSTIKNDSQASTQSEFFFVKSEVKGKLIKINFDDIDFIESQKNYVAIHYNGKKILALQSLKDIDEKLPINKFIRVHRSFIVALNKIVGIEGSFVKLKNINAEILLGETYKAGFIDRMKNTII
jgi:DNA-binding LytR/AlgR family response regulator